MENISIIRIAKLGELIALLTVEGCNTTEFGTLTCSHEYSNGETDFETVTGAALMKWLISPKGILVIANGTHTGNCVGDETATIAVSKSFGLYFVTKKWSDENSPTLLFVIGLKQQI